MNHNISFILLCLLFAIPCHGNELALNTFLKNCQKEAKGASFEHSQYGYIFIGEVTLKCKIGNIYVDVACKSQKGKKLNIDECLNDKEVDLLKDTSSGEATARPKKKSSPTNVEKSKTRGRDE